MTYEQRCKKILTSNQSSGWLTSNIFIMNERDPVAALEDAIILKELLELRLEQEIRKPRK